MVNDLGDGLNILILTSVGEDWKTFSTWYSIYKNLPDANIEIICIRKNKIVEFQMHQWVKRINIPITYINHSSKDNIHQKLTSLTTAIKRGFVGYNKKCMLIDSSVMVLDSLNNELVNLFNQSESKIYINDNIWFINSIEKSDIDNILNEYVLLGNFGNKVNNSERLALEAKESQELLVFTTYNKGCGKWINNMQGCPFSVAGSLITEHVTINEMRIIELWKKMVSLYSTVL